MAQEIEPLTEEEFQKMKDEFDKIVRKNVRENNRMFPNLHPDDETKQFVWSEVIMEQERIALDQVQAWLAPRLLGC
jgi:GTPase Era involved in 16S rRNA processing